MKIHPLCEMWPVLPDDQLAELAEDIKANGLRQKILIYDGQVIDGRNRLMAMERAGIEVAAEHFEHWKGANPAALVISLNARRRHMPLASRALMVAKIRSEWLPGSQSEPKMTIAEAAKVAKLSPAVIKRANTVITQGIDAVQSAAASGAVGLKAAARVAKMPKPKQRRAAASGPSGIKAAAAAAVKPAAPEPGQAKAMPWTVAMRDEAVRRLQACYESNKAKWNSPPPPAPRIVVDAMIWAMNEGAGK